MFKYNLFNKKLIKNLLLPPTNNLTNIANILQNPAIGNKITIKGWIKSLRKQKENVFIDLSDGSTDKKLQILISHALKPNELTTGSSVVATGCLSLSPKGSLELKAETVEIQGKCVVTDGYPFAPRKQYPPEYIRQHLHFRPRTNKFGALLRVRNKATLAFYNYLDSEGFINIHTPILTSNDCEGAGEIFKIIPDNEQVIKSMIKPGISVDEAYFNTKTFLTVSGQLHLEAAAHGLSKVYSFGPTFRAENSRSRLHLSEFYMLEVEQAFVEKLDEVIDVIERLIKNVTKTIIEGSPEDVKRCQDEDKDNFSWLNSKFPILTYEEACNILEANREKFKEKFDEKHGFCKEHELFLTKHCGEIPTFIINWPKDMKSFYMRECDEDSTKVAALDLLAPNVGEIVGGSLRENNLNKLKDKLPNKASKQFDWYLDLRKFGGVPTAGFGLGFERYLQFILQISNIKDTIPFPRWPHNCSL